MDKNKPLVHGSLFSGIGGFDLAAEWMGWENLFHCEWNEFGQRVLKHYWPNATSHDDITTTDFRPYAGRVSVLSGGFPCQPYSTAGKRLGKEDERHLWPEMLRAIREVSPRYVVGENVRGLVNWNDGLVFDEVQADLEAEGYEVQPFLLPACGVNAPHRRDRIWFVAYAEGNGSNRTPKATSGEVRRSDREQNPQFAKRSEVRNATNTHSELRQWRDKGAAQRRQDQGERIEPLGNNQPRRKPSNWGNFPTESPICSGNDGLSRELDGITFPKWRNESIKAYGNAIVPQVAYQIFKAIQMFNDQHFENG